MTANKWKLQEKKKQTNKNRVPTPEKKTSTTNLYAEDCEPFRIP